MIEQSRAAYQAQLQRDRRLLVGIAGLVLVVGIGCMSFIAGIAG